jgi:FKBP-type peptidyl-prolyl cis-trans isomerase 2
MPTRLILFLSAILFLSTMSAALLLGQRFLNNFFRAYPTLVKSDNGVVRDGAKVTVRFHIRLRDTPTTTYSDTDQFVQGQHIIPPAIEQQVAGMQPGEAKTFPLSAEEGFGLYDENRTTTIQTADLPLDALEGDIVNDYEDRTAVIVRIFPETTVLDLNHPLAGKPLIVTLQIVAIENLDDKDKNTETGNGDHPSLVRLSKV